MEDNAAPSSWSNWIQHSDGKPVTATYEHILYSDAWFTGGTLAHGPYRFLNLVPLVQSTEFHQNKPALVLRMQQLLEFQVAVATKTDDANYHGGTLVDEIAALVSLLLGVRIAAGPVTREFRGTDPMGAPRAHSFTFTPMLQLAPRSPQIPSLHVSRSLSDLKMLDLYPELDEAMATTLVKSARLYQNALWYADATPELSWLLLVSAVETAAVFWDAEEHDRVERLELSFPYLAKRLREDPDSELLDYVAKELKGLIGSTAKFWKFMDQFKPAPPEHRPKLFCFDFNPKSYKSAMKKIYGYRSKALHEGTPFPLPMCEPPGVPVANDFELNEIPIGLATNALGATWAIEDTPMLLHLFSYIVQRALLLWWEDVASKSRLVVS